MSFADSFASARKAANRTYLCDLSTTGRYSLRLVKIGRVDSQKVKGEQFLFAEFQVLSAEPDGLGNTHMAEDATAQHIEEGMTVSWTGKLTGPRMDFTMATFREIMASVAGLNPRSVRDAEYGEGGRVEFVSRMAGTLLNDPDFDAEEHESNVQVYVDGWNEAQPDWTMTADIGARVFAKTSNSKNEKFSGRTFAEIEFFPLKAHPLASVPAFSFDAE